MRNYELCCIDVLLFMTSLSDHVLSRNQLEIRSKE